MDIGKATQGKEVLHLVSNIVSPQLLRTNFKMNFTSLHITSLHFTTDKYFSRYAPIYPPSLHYPTLHYITLIGKFNTYFLQFTTLITFLTLCLKAFGLQGRVAKISAGNRFQSRMILFTKLYFPISVLCILFLIFRSCSNLLT